MLCMFVKFFNNPLTAAQQLLHEENDGDLERKTIMLRAVKGQQQNEGWDSTLCAVTVATDLDPSVSVHADSGN